MEPPKDFLGQAIEVGDLVAYPGRGSSSIWMNAGTVTAIEEYTEEAPWWDGHKHRGYKLIIDVHKDAWKTYETPRKSHTRMLDRVVVVRKGEK